jgi:hypothetical protein
VYARVVAGELRRVSGSRRDFTWAGRALVAATIGIFESWLALADRPPVKRLVDELEPLYAAPLNPRP